MEIIELINLCGCLLELAALFSSGGATYSGYQAYRARKNPPEPATPPRVMWRFLIWLVIAIGLVVLVITKWAAAMA
jgi:hypothetical protein